LIDEILEILSDGAVHQVSTLELELGWKARKLQICLQLLFDYAFIGGFKEMRCSDFYEVQVSKSLLEFLKRIKEVEK